MNALSLITVYVVRQLVGIIFTAEGGLSGRPIDAAALMENFMEFGTHGELSLVDLGIVTCHAPRLPAASVVASEACRRSLRIWQLLGPVGQTKKLLEGGGRKLSTCRLLVSNGVPRYSAACTLTANS